uniref:Gnk2-homologous domain-containing protein n=1 Tax=Salix viminalis TaxID=40686 RepID=A0A6N2KY75_SALVM
MDCRQHLNKREYLQLPSGVSEHLVAKMNSPIKFSSTILLYLLTLSVITRAQSLNNPNYLHHICDDTTTSTTTYKDNLNLLLSSLSSSATRNSIGFFNASEGREPDDVYGLFFCRGDLSTDVCQNCVANATKDIVQRRCPTANGGSHMV